MDEVVFFPQENDMKRDLTEPGQLCINGAGASFFRRCGYLASLTIRHDMARYLFPRPASEIDRRRLSRRLSTPTAEI